MLFTLFQRPQYMFNPGELNTHFNNIAYYFHVYRPDVTQRNMSSIALLGQHLRLHNMKRYKTEQEQCRNNV
jgi:hypothetical protein